MTLAKWFKVDLTEVKYVEVPKVEYKERTVALEGTIKGDVTVTGNMTVEGELSVLGAVSCLGVVEKDGKLNTKEYVRRGEYAEQ